MFFNVRLLVKGDFQFIDNIINFRTFSLIGGICDRLLGDEEGEKDGGDEIRMEKFYRSRGRRVYIELYCGFGQSFFLIFQNCLII